MTYIDTPMRSFYLSDKFLEQYKGRQPNWGELGFITYKRTYSRFLPEKNRKEEYWETLQRVVEGSFNLQKRHCTILHIPWENTKAQKRAQRMYEKMWDFKFLPSGRAMWLMGTEFVEKHGSAGLNSCAFTTTKNIDEFPTDPFLWAMGASMLGIGVGYDTEGGGLLRVDRPETKDKTVFTIDDSREGWIASLEVLLKAYFLGDDLPEFDYSEIRPAGKLLKHFGGISAGMEPLKMMHEELIELFESKVGLIFDSVDIVDVFTTIAKCIVSGNVRRSAMIALGKFDDEDFLSMKKDLNNLKNRWAANISVIVENGFDYDKAVDLFLKTGEPGLIWLNNIKNYGRMVDGYNPVDTRVVGVNPCGEQALEDMELCNLVETFPSKHESYEEFEETLFYALLFGKSVTLLDTHWAKTNAVMLRNRRLGISQSGIVNAFVKHGKKTMRDWCNKGYNFLRKKDESMSDAFCIRTSIKITSVKPSGTISLLPGVSPGIHFPHSEYYIRRIRFAENSPLIPILGTAGYHVEKDTYSNNTVVVEFPVRTENFDRSKECITIWEQLSNAAMYQKYWADNQVSITVTVQEDEKDQVVVALETFEDQLKAVSFLPLSGGGYVQAPYEEITKKQYLKMKAKISKIDLCSMTDAAEGEQFCTNDSCEVKSNG